MKTKTINFLDKLGLFWFIPMVRLLTWEEPQEQIKQLCKMFVLPLIGITLFIVAWYIVANNVETSVGKLPGPQETFVQAQNMIQQYKQEKQRKQQFFEKEQIKKERYEKQFQKPYKIAKYNGNKTIIDYIITSLYTVFFGFFLAFIIGVPLGLFCGLNKSFNNMINPIIQLCRPVSPLAWVLIVIVLIDGLMELKEGVFTNTFFHAAITVALCSVWAIVSNATLGVSSVDKNYLNVAKVLKLSRMETITKIILPSAMPFIFTGLRISLGIGWMVLIVSEMMASQQGLGYYIDLLYQNNNADSLAKIIVCIFIIGFIGAILDRLMFSVQRLVSYNAKS